MKPVARTASVAPARVPSEPVVFHAHVDEAALVERVCAAVLETIAGERRRLVDALLLLSGGATPVPVYRALAAALGCLPTDNARLTISLVDERWVAPGDAGSNERLLRESLLGAGREAVHGIGFWPLADWDQGLAASVAGANARLQGTAGAISLVLFGMGDDGHTASLFPGSADLLPALGASTPYVALDATGCPGAGTWPQRITLTPIGWKSARRRLLLIRGAHKRQLLERAMRERDIETLPICAALALGDAPLEVHWAP
jgi:6-phosphogluconolactonase